MKRGELKFPDEAPPYWIADLSAEQVQELTRKDRPKNAADAVAKDRNRPR